MYTVNCGQLWVISPTSVFVGLMTNINKGRITKKIKQKKFHTTLVIKPERICYTNIFRLNLPQIVSTGISHLTQYLISHK